MDEIYTVIGRRKVDFDTPDGKHIVGWSIFATVPREGIDGVACEKFFLSDDKFRASPFKLGDSVNITFNRFGKVALISPVRS